MTYDPLGAAYWEALNRARRLRTERQRREELRQMRETLARMATRADSRHFAKGGWVRPPVEGVPVKVGGETVWDITSLPVPRNGCA